MSIKKSKKVNQMNKKELKSKISRLKTLKQDQSRYYKQVLKTYVVKYCK